MIHNFSVENFYSIGDKIEVNFVSTAKNPRLKELYLDAPIERKVSKINLIGGSNASGKTNVLRVLAFLRYFITDSVEKKRIAYNKNAFLLDRDTKLSVEFSIDDGGIYTYHLVINEKNIVKIENLLYKKKINKRSREILVYSRDLDEESNKYSYHFNVELKSLEQRNDVGDILNSNPATSLIALCSGFDTKDGHLRLVKTYWEGVCSNILMFGILESNPPMMQLAKQTLGEVYENTTIRESVEELLRKFDIGFNGIRKRADELSANGPEYGIIHEYKNKKYATSVEFESSGTQRLIIESELIVTALLTKNGIAIIDELDAFLHPDIFNEIIEMFASPLKNPNNAQLIFSTQNYSVMSKLEKQQITLVEKLNDGFSNAFRLDDINGIRTDENYYLKYLSGEYGGVPNLR
jgi:AAA15 family ATPase/GTPase